MPTDTTLTDSTLTSDRAGLAELRRGKLGMAQVRAIGGAATILAGPAFGLLAWRGLGMSPIQALAIAFLLSAWLGPRLLRRAH